MRLLDLENGIMNQIILLVSFFIVGQFAACGAYENVVVGDDSKSVIKEEVTTKAGKAPVLVELFTSEGCSSCPPADRVLAKLHKEQPVENAEIITLAFHVDYWDYLGWKDEFSSAEYSKRQNDYSNALRLRSNYTPQMIVDGVTEFVGSREATALSEIGKASKKVKGTVGVSVDKDLNLKADFKNIPKSETVEAFLAIAESNIETDVKRGENRGRKLSHVSVVRSLVKLGGVDGETGTFKAERSLKLKAGWKRENLEFVVFAQDPQTRKVYAVGATRIN